jgi:Tfp pilus assembly protein PilE
MANVSEKFGLRPYRKLDGTPLVGAQNRYTIASNYGTAIFQGDLVQPTAAGNIERHTAGTSDAVVGVFNGVFYTDPTTQKPTYKNYYPGSVVASDITAFVVDDPDAVFLMDADEAFTRANLYANYSVTNTTGVTQTGISKVQLDVSATGTASTFVVQAIDISQDPDNSDTATSNANILVRINNHFYRSGTGIA